MPESSRPAKFQRSSAKVSQALRSRITQGSRARAAPAFRSLILAVSDGELDEAVARAETEVALTLGVKKLTLMASGLTALQAALHAARVGPGDQVACDVVFPFAVMAIRNVGARPIPVDIELDNFTMSPDDLIRRLTKKTRAVIATAMFGVPPLTASLRVALRDRPNIILIEDHAQAFGGRIGDVAAVARPDIACMSFQSGKLLSAGAGGAVIARSPEHDTAARRYIELGWYPRKDMHGRVNWASQWRERSADCISARMSPIGAELLRSRLIRFNELRARLETECEDFAHLLATQLSPWTLQHVEEGFGGTRWRIALIAPNREMAQETLARANASSSSSYALGYPPVSDWPQFQISAASLPNTRRLLDSAVLVPSGTLEDIEREREAWSTGVRAR
jgi:dTDP-4-amino-4,6-dideoxygalactose transaminase